MAATPLALKRVNIYEVVNHTRRESLIALTPEDVRSLRQRVRSEPPAGAKHWNAMDVLEFELLATRMTPAHAEHFLKLFLENPQMRDWRLIPWRQ